MKKVKSGLLKELIAFSVLFLLLLVPDSNKATIIKATNKPFAWNKDEL